MLMKQASCILSMLNLRCAGLKSFMNESKQPRWNLKLWKMCRKHSGISCNGEDYAAVKKTGCMKTGFVGEINK